MAYVFAEARENMIENQIRPNNIVDKRIVDAMRDVPREEFVPRHLQGLAYVDEDIALGNGRFLPEPLVLARLLQAAEIKDTDVVLDIGCGTGYSSALIGKVAATVVGLEQRQDMADEADKLLHDMGIINALVIQQDDLRDGFPPQEPYDVIVINGSVPRVPEGVKHQLADDGGRLVAVLSPDGHLGQGVCITRRQKDFETAVLFDASVPTLTGFELEERFIF